MKRFTMFTLRVQFAVLVALTAILFAPIRSEAKDVPFRRIIVLGDSLSDTGNFFELSGGFPPAPYFEGRASNGRLWVEYLADGFGMSISAGDNFAFFGATTSSFNINDGMGGNDFPGLREEVEELLSQNPTGLDPDALYILWTGANDFFAYFQTGGDPAVMIANGVGNTATAVQRLAAAGARHILVPNVPDIGLTPFAISSGSAPLVTQLASAYNNALHGAFVSLGNAGIPIIELDTFATFEGMVEYARMIGFSNVTESFLPAMEGDVSEFLFWDNVHPTTRAHQVLAEVARFELVEYFRHGNGSGRLNLPRAIAHAR
jgi:phospholipase/lecithinase/hemolysin